MVWPPQNTGYFDPQKCVCCEPVGCCTVEYTMSGDTNLYSYTITDDELVFDMQTGTAESVPGLSASLGAYIRVAGPTSLTVFHVVTGSAEIDYDPFGTHSILDPNGDPITADSCTGTDDSKTCVFTLPEAGCYRFGFNATLTTGTSLMTAQATLTFDTGMLDCEAFVETLSEGGGGPM